MMSNAKKAPNGSTWLRFAVFIVGGLETAAVLILLGIIVSSGQLASGEALSRSLGWAIVAIYGVAYLICVVPALILAAVNRRLLFALALCFLVVPVIFLAFRHA